MERKINYENLRYFAYSNDKIVNGKIRGVVLDFFGLGCQAMYHDDIEVGKFYAERGVLFVVPYTNPWGWMNRDEVRLTDEILDVLFEKYAKRTPVGCVANCPVCDMPYHCTERVDLPRTIYSAFYGYDCSFEEALLSCSPLHLAPTLPEKTEYTVFHCEKDDAVNIDMHSASFVSELSKYRDVQYYTVPDRGHCDLDEENAQKYREIILSYIEKNS